MTVADLERYGVRRIRRRAAFPGRTHPHHAFLQIPNHQLHLKLQYVVGSPRMDHVAVVILSDDCSSTLLCAFPVLSMPRLNLHECFKADPRCEWSPQSLEIDALSVVRVWFEVTPIFLFRTSTFTPSLEYPASSQGSLTLIDVN